MNVVSEATTLTTAAAIVVGVGGPAPDPVLGAMTGTRGAVTVGAEAGAVAGTDVGVIHDPRAGRQGPSLAIVDLLPRPETETIRRRPQGVATLS